MRILFVSDRIPFPAVSGGDIRVAHLVNALLPLGRVTFVAPRCETIELDSTSRLESIFERVSCAEDVPAERPRSKHLERLRVGLRYLHPTHPAGLEDSPALEIANTFGRIDNTRFDFVWMEQLTSLPIYKRVDALPCVVDLHDVQHRRLRNKIENTDVGWRAPFLQLEYVRLKRLECRLAEKGLNVVVCSEAERQSLGGGNNVCVVPNGSQIPKDASVLRQPRNSTLLFVGAMDYEANEDAVLFMARDIFPRVRSRIRDAKLLVVGRNPSPKVRALSDGQSVRVTGTVDDVGPYYDESAVMVVPLRFGGGTRLKILEGMARRIPIVSTAMGADGLNVVNGEHLLVVDGADAIAEACVQLLGRPEKCEDLSSRAFELVSKKYNWNHIEETARRLVVRACG